VATRAKRCKEDCASRLKRSTIFLPEYQSLSNDELRSKTQDFKDRIKQHLAEIDEKIQTKKTDAEDLPVTQINEKDIIYQEIDALKKGPRQADRGNLTRTVTRGICSSKRNFTAVQRKPNTGKYSNRTR
jgi:preprotein translocase subunit SecA